MPISDEFVTNCPLAPSVSLVIPVKDDWKRLELCLAALNTQDYPAPLEILVVDDHSSEPAPINIGRHPGVKLLRNTGRGAYAARNMALKHASHFLLAFTDADCIPSRHWIRSGIEALLSSREELIIAAGKVNIFLEARDRLTPAAAYDLAYGIRQDRYVKQGFAATANLFSTRRTFDKVGPFRNDLMSGGDKEWCLRARAEGAQIVFAANAELWHPARSDEEALTQKFLRLAKGRLDRAETRWQYLKEFLLLLLPPSQPFRFLFSHHHYSLLQRFAVVSLGLRIWRRRTMAIFRNSWRHA